MQSSIALRTLAPLTLALVSSLSAQDDLEKRATWSIPSTAEVKARLDDYLSTKSLNETSKLKIETLWPDDAQPLDGGELLDRLTASLAAIEPKAAEVVAAIRHSSGLLVAPQFAGLTDQSLSAFVRDNLRLLVGRWLAQHDLVDESLEVLKDVGPENVADPATLLFYQAVGHHRVLKKDECLTTVAKLLEHESDLPRRYVTLARLMEADIKPLKEDSLDEIARLMDDIRRRLALARAGKVVRDEEDSVIAKLEKMIDELEKQRQMRQQQKQQSKSKSGRRPPNNPMQDSQRAELKGPGEVDPKNVGKRDGWGNLPPKERQEVLQQIGRELPAHFRETIEEYFKRLAQDRIP
ncbi:MAG TPA: hypothetical protein VKH44_05445 [Pirellulaceae bacterium]|nr:hypothetical protein [Pirellulaceae bacterium]